jgi:hypothetical protein
VIDVRGQSISETQLSKLFEDINAKSGNLFEDRGGCFRTDPSNGNLECPARNVGVRQKGMVKSPDFLCQLEA